ncbi:MAG: hypothetical protein HUJ31_09055 [Pseudomonadales bacterium]|nr:hypothetical protein [Pseudomonadales bacterium]
MKHKLLIGLICFLLTSPVAASEASPLHIHAYGYGPVKVGMTPREASKVLGVELVQIDENVFDGCHYVYPDGDYSSMGYMVQDDVIVRIDVRDESVRTLSGLAVGAKEEEIQTRFKSKVRISEHPYGAGAHYVSVNVYGENLLLFETRAEETSITEDDRLLAADYRISRFRVGKPSAVSLIEGCL